MAQPGIPDIQAPFDPTGFQSISGASLLQFLSGAFPQIDRGFVLVTADIAGNAQVPNATINPRWQRYVWIRQSATSVGVYVWNPNGATDATFLNWVSVNIAGIAAGSIVNSMIADNTIQASKIVSIQYSQITGAPSGLAPSGAAGGVLTGNYPNPSIGAGQVTGSMIAAGTITAANIAGLTLTLATMAPVSGSAKDMARVNAGATGMEAFTPPVIFTSGVVVPATNSLKVPQVNVGATDFQMVAPTTLGRVLQIVETEDASTDSTANNIASNALPTTASGKHYVALDTAITPINSGSTLLIEGVVFMACAATAAQLIVIALMQDAVVNCLAVACNASPGNAAGLSPVVLKFKVASGSTAARTYKIYFGGTNASGNTVYLNQIGAGAVFGGGFPLSSLRVTEYI